MKIFKILIIAISFFAYGCSISTETQIKNSLKLTGYYNTDISEIIVTDTIYQSEVDSFMRADTIMLNFLQEKFTRFDKLKDSIRKTPRQEHLDPIKTKYIKEIFDSVMMYNRWIDIIKERNYLHQTMNRNYYDTYPIRGYRIIVYAENGRIDELTLSNDYSYICPSFIFDPLDSIFRFKPRHHKMIPQKFITNNNRHDNIRQTFGR